MIKVKVVERCPYTVAGSGVMHVKHDVLATLAGAVWDKDEWIALLVGKRSEDGLSITVDSLKVPLQERAHASCELARPEPLGEDVVGVVHSHHTMGAFFSQIDDDTLNPRFPSSLVVAQPRAGASQHEKLLGFCYQAEGRAPLPCGSPGIIRFNVLPSPNMSDWPLVATAGFSEPDASISLHDCPHTTKKQKGMNQTCSTKCNLITTEAMVAVFGVTGEVFMAEVQQKTQPSKHFNGHHGGKKGKYFYQSWGDPHDGYDGRYNERYSIGHVRTFPAPTIEEGHRSRPGTFRCSSCGQYKSEAQMFCVSSDGYDCCNLCHYNPSAYNNYY